MNALYIAALLAVLFSSWFIINAYLQLKMETNNKENLYSDYDRDEDGHLLSCCGDILDEDIMICPTCHEHN